MNDSVTEADSLKQLRGVTNPGDAGGVQPGDWPIRLKGYYRALRRKEAWALRLSIKTGIDFSFAWIYGRPSCLRDLFYRSNPFLTLIQKDTSGENFPPIPLVFGDRS